MKAFKHPLASAALLSSLPFAISANAEENASAGFQHQVSYYNIDNTLSLQGSDIVGYRYYFEQVDDSTIPVLLVEQLAQTGFVNANWVTGSGADIFAVSGEAYLTDDWYLGGQVSYFDMKSLFDSVDLDTYSFEIWGGYDFSKYTSVSTSVFYSKDDERVSSSASASDYLGVVFFDPGFYNTLERFAGVPPVAVHFRSTNDTRALETESYIVRLDATHYLKLSDNQGVNFKGVYSYYDVRNVSELSIPISSGGGRSINYHHFDLAADWFITPNWSIGATYNYLDTSGRDSLDSWRAQTAYQYRFDNGVYLGIEYLYNFETETDLFYLNAGWRF
ncbi:hypothetical protein [Thalassotalea litorea]|uniref:hypothetical protein n=1 Tax=Thalassotalea litorea TaxID=2020715 RepID=UPI003735069B